MVDQLVRLDPVLLDRPDSVTLVYRQFEAESVLLVSPLRDLLLEIVGQEEGPAVLGR